MPELWLDPAADRILDALAADATRRRLAERIEAVLDALERDPGRAELRRHRFMIGLWGVVVAADGDEWVVLWESHPTIDDAIIIHYVGPASFS